jgi:hypothetical protein
MKHKYNVVNSAKNRPNLWKFSKKNSINYFQWFRSYKFFYEALQPRVFAKKLNMLKRMTDKC